MKRRIFKTILCISFIAVMLVSVCLVSQAANDDGPVRYGRTTLSGDELVVYDKLVEGLMADTPYENISFGKSVSESDVTKALYVFMSDYPECFWIGSSYSLTSSGGSIIGMTPSYLFKGAALSEAKSDVETAINEFMAGMPNNASNYEKALFLHDAIANKVDYVLGSDHNQSIYSALVNKESVCAGYAETYQLLLRKAGIQAWTVTGTSRGQNHAWNVVWLDASTCVYTDVTWDDQGSQIFRSYFNLSRAEMALDHITNGDLFSLPTCTHDDKGYFDVYSQYVLRADSTVDQIAALFEPSTDGTTRTATIYDPNGIFSNWYYNNGWALYHTLGGTGSNAPSTDGSTVLNGEYKLKLTGTFSVGAYTVTVGGSNIYLSTSSGASNQTVETGNAIEDIYIEVADGYYFPVGYSVQSTCGITVERLSYTVLKISGTPTGNVSLSLTSPTAKTKAEKPTGVSFSATGVSTGKLTGVSAGMKYRVGSTGSWKTVSSSADIQLTGLSACTIYVKRVGDDTKYDSDIHSISVSKTTKPTLVATQPTTVGGKGRIPTTTAHEYSKNQTSWTACSGALTGLDAGTYYVRVKANGTSLASDTQTIRIKEYTPNSVTGVTIDETLSIYIGGKGTPSYTVSPSNAANKDVTFSSSNPDVATVNSTTGEVTGVSKGTAVITITTVDGGYTDTCTVNVECDHDFSGPIKYNDDKHWQECKCGEKNGEEDHEFSAWSVFEEATAQKDGSEKRSCECGYSETRPLPYVPAPDGNGGGSGNQNGGGSAVIPDGSDSLGGGENGGAEDNKTESTDGVKGTATETTKESESKTETEPESVDEEHEISVGCETSINGGTLTLVLLCIGIAFATLLPKTKKEN